MKTVNPNTQRVAPNSSQATADAPAPTYSDKDIATLLKVRGLTEEEVQACLIAARPTLAKALPLLGDPATRREGKHLLAEAFRAAGIPGKRAKETAHKFAEGVKSNSDLVWGAIAMGFAIYKKDPDAAVKIGGTVAKGRLDGKLRERAGAPAGNTGFAPSATESNKIVGTNAAEENIVSSMDLGIPTK